MNQPPPLWTFDALLAATRGTLDGTAPAAITGISIDTRSLEPGDLFVASERRARRPRLRHRRLQSRRRRRTGRTSLRTQTRRRRAAPRRRSAPRTRAIAAAARARFSPPAQVIAVTGSAGKTGTKEMLRACLAPLGKTHAPEKSFNNHWGVPLTLARMPTDTQFAVIEIGMNHAGEITPLTTLVAPAYRHHHQRPARPPRQFSRWRDRRRQRQSRNLRRSRIRRYGNPPPRQHSLRPAVVECAFNGFERRDVRPRHRSRHPAQARTHDNPNAIRARSIEAFDDRSVITADAAGRVVAYTLGAPGHHLAMNSLAVAAAWLALVWPLPTALPALAAIRAPAGRGARSTIALADRRRTPAHRRELQRQPCVDARSPRHPRNRPARHTPAASPSSATCANSAPMPQRITSH